MRKNLNLEREGLSKYEPMPDSQNTFHYEEIYPHLLKQHLNLHLTATEIEYVVCNTLILNRHADSELKKITVKTSCHKKCSYCCYLNIDTFAHERILILTYLPLLLPDEHIQETISLQIKEWGQRFRTLQSQYKFDNFTSDKEKYQVMIEKYESAKIPCPFLLNGECFIYPVRPVVCRTYLSSSPPTQCADRGQFLRPQVSEITKTKYTTALDIYDRKFFHDSNESPLQPLGCYFSEHLPQINNMLSAIKEYAQMIQIDDRPVCTHPYFNNIPVFIQQQHPYWPIYKFLEKCFKRIDAMDRFMPEHPPCG